MYVLCAYGSEKKLIGLFSFHIMYTEIRGVNFIALLIYIAYTFFILYESYCRPYQIQQHQKTHTLAPTQKLSKGSNSKQINLIDLLICQFIRKSFTQSQCIERNKKKK